MTQGSLDFDGPVAHVRTSDTSREMARRAQPGAVTLRELVYATIKGCGTHGTTDDEMEQVLGRSHQSVSSTRRFLVKKGHVQDSGIRRNTRYGNPATVWITTE